MRRAQFTNVIQSFLSVGPSKQWIGGMSGHRRLNYNRTLLGVKEKIGGFPSDAWLKINTAA